jgi:hypothetical protein
MAGFQVGREDCNTTFPTWELVGFSFIYVDGGVSGTSVVRLIGVCVVVLAFLPSLFLLIWGVLGNSFSFALLLTRW